jgi:probable F420-dependent oxidoreductase
VKLSPLGIWSRELRWGDPGQIVIAAAELEELGFDVLWIPDIGGPVFDAVERLLAATKKTVVATGVINIWMHQPADVAAGQADLERRYPGRFLLGLGVGHASVVDDGHPGRYQRPLETMRSYLDALDNACPDGSRLPRILAALGPKMLALASERTDGVHPYLVPVEHTRVARRAVGPSTLLAQEVSVVLGSDIAECRDRARADLAIYLELPNYTNTWRRLGFTDADHADGGSNRLIDALYALGTVDAVARRIEEYDGAGADHVCLRAVGDGNPLTSEELPVAAWRELASLARGR